MNLQTWGWNVLVAIDQHANTLVKGDPDETLSSRAAKARILGHRWGCVLCRILDWLHADHCTKSLEHDRGRRLPV